MPLVKEFVLSTAKGFLIYLPLVFIYSFPCPPAYLSGSKAYDTVLDVIISFVILKAKSKK